MSGLIPRKFLFIICFMLTCFLGVTKAAYGQSSHKLQALYIYSFAKYISWEKDSSNFVIGVLGESEIVQELEKGAIQRKIGGRPVEVVRYNELSDMRYCHILYLPGDYSRLLPRLLDFSEGKPILIVSEDDLAKKGAGISFFVEDDRLRFKINIEALTSVGLLVNKGLLNLGVVI